MPSRLQEVLKEKVEAKLRSSTNLATRNVIIHMVEKVDEATAKTNKFVQVEIQASKPADSEEKEDGDAPVRQNSEIIVAENSKTSVEGTGAETMNIKLNDIFDVKVKNFTDKHMQIWVMSVTCDDAEAGTRVQHFFEFKTAEKRDDWGNGLRSLHHAHQWMHKRTEAKADIRKLHLIKSINLLLPKTGMILSMEIETAGGRKDVLHIADDPNKYDSATCKDVTQSFVMQNCIIPAEGASLYRFIRSVISRVIMERETNNLLTDIDKLRFNSVIEGRRSSASATDPQNILEIRGLLHLAEAKLRDLSENVPKRIGRHGPSSGLLIDIMKRSIEKTRIYNRMAFTVNFGQAGEELDF